MKTLNLRELTRIHWSLLGLAVLGTTFLLTTEPARSSVRHHVGALGAAMLSQAQTGPIAPMTGTELIAPRAAAAQCSDSKKQEVLAEVTPSASTPVHIDCSLTLKLEDVITKQLIFEGATASGVTVECNGATIGTSNQDPKVYYMVEIRSLKNGPLRYVRPENVTLRNCKIIGSVGVYGLFGEGVEVTQRTDYVTLARNNAPRSIVFDHVTITGIGGDILYLFSGVSDFQMLDSEIKGSTNGVNIYLDAESYRNTFRNNRIHATTSKREVMALDGSSYNTIVNNHFSALNHGGIYLYRNCGEDGGIRHSTPSSNTIINNVFYYNKYDGDRPSIFVASRNGTCCGDPLYCDDDKGYPFGSSVSNYDHAQFNVVMQNQIYKRLVSDMIRVDRPDINTPNYIDHNETVDAEIERGAGCYISNGYPNFILDGQFINLFHTSNGEPVCLGYRDTCNDGALSRSSDSTCQVSQVSQVDFECQATGNNDGCLERAFCPPGKRIVGGKAACNLEFGTVSSTDLNGVPANSVEVLRASDNVSAGFCTLGTSIRSGQAAVSGINGRNHTSFGCREHDSNGGDCHIKGRLYCSSDSTQPTSQIDWLIPVLSILLE